MQFHTTSDYAIRTVMYLAMHPDRCCSAGELEQQMGVPAQYLHKVTSKLKKAGLIQTAQGNGGGYRLCADASTISLYDILSLTEQTLEINGCLVDKDFCSRHATETCPVRRVYCESNKTFHQSLKNISIEHLLHSVYTSSD